MIEGACCCELVTGCGELREGERQCFEVPGACAGDSGVR